MLIRQTETNLAELRLKSMARAYLEQCNDPNMLDLSFDERFGLLVDAEKQARENNRLTRLFRLAKLKVNASPEDIDYRTPRGLDRQVMNHLITCQYIVNTQNVFITGSTGLGKTWLSCALANAAIRKHYNVLSIRFARLLEELNIARGDGTLRKYRAKLAKADLLIIDDWGLSPMSALDRHELLELVDDRGSAGSIIITSQLPISQWHDYIGEPTVADAILDRLVHRAHRIELAGDSMRKPTTAN